MQNIELAWDAIGRIKREPGSFRMRYWGAVRPTGYTACLAGHTMLASGYRLVGTNAYLRPDGSPVAWPGLEAGNLLGFTPEECRRGTHWWKCNVFCENSQEDAAMDLFLKLIFEEEERRLSLTAA